MNIGKILRAWRISMGLSQTEMAAGVVSESYYSKVERGVHSIDAEALLRILQAHNLSLQSFGELLNKNENKKKRNPLIDKYALEMNVALNKKDVDELKKIKKELKRKNAPTYLMDMWKRVFVTLTHDNSIYTKAEKSTLKKRLIRNNNWELATPYETIQLDMYVLDFKDMYQIINQAIRGFEKLKAPGAVVEMAAGAAALFFLRRCKDDQVDLKYTKSSLEFLKRRPYTVVNLNALIYGAYYEAYFAGDTEKAEKILEPLKYAREFSEKQ